MATYVNVIENLKTLGREDAIQALGDLYELDHGKLREYVLDRTEVYSTAGWIDKVMSWYEAGKITNIHWASIHAELRRFKD